MSDHSSSSSNQPDRTSSTTYARNAIDSRLGVVQREAEAVEVDTVEDQGSLQTLGDAVYALLTATDVFGHWLPGRTLSKVQSRLDKASRWSVGLLELRTFEAELTTEEAVKIEQIDRIRERINGQLRRAKVKLSLATKELTRSRFGDDVRELTTDVRWTGDGDEPDVESIGAETILGAKNEFLLTASEGVPHFTTLHLLLLQLRRLRSLMDLFQDRLDRDASSRIVKDLKDLNSDLAPAALSSAVMIMATRMMGNCTEDEEARALREFVPAVSARAETLFDQLRSVWSRQFIEELEGEFSSLLNHCNIGESE